jgi:hypothetical protein
VSTLDFAEFPTLGFKKGVNTITWRVAPGKANWQRYEGLGIGPKRVWGRCWRPCPGLDSSTGVRIGRLCLHNQSPGTPMTSGVDFAVRETLFTILTDTWGAKSSRINGFIPSENRFPIQLLDRHFNPDRNHSLLSRPVKGRFGDGSEREANIFMGR